MIRSIRFRGVMALLFMMSLGQGAWAIVQARIDSPADNTVVQRGQEVTITATGSNSVLGMRSLTVWVNTVPARWDFPLSSYTMDKTVYVVFTVPESYPLGGIITVRVVAEDWVDPSAEATIYLYVGFKPDSVPPVFSEGLEGILGAERLPGGESARVWWSPASDDQTPNDQMRYAVYCSETQGTVFSTAPVKITSGTLTAVITGLEPQTVYHVGVRAQDGAGNRDSNLKTVALEAWRNAADEAWLMYE